MFHHKSMEIIIPFILDFFNSFYDKNYSYYAKIEINSLKIIVISVLLKSVVNFEEKNNIYMSFCEKGIFDIQYPKKGTIKQKIIYILFLIATTLSIPYLILVNYLFYHGKNQWISFCSILTTIVYVGALVLLMFKSIEWVPYASIISAVVILPILWLMTKKVEHKK